ncbi:hypothetical protein NL676_019936 [Syzygium grande]|nr:hypothetical protein NL676_019936 [Syzygium grande]
MGVSNSQSNDALTKAVEEIPRKGTPTSFVAEVTWADRVPCLVDLEDEIRKTKKQRKRAREPNGQSYTKPKSQREGGGCKSINEEATRVSEPGRRDAAVRRPPRPPPRSSGNATRSEAAARTEALLFGEQALRLTIKFPPRKKAKDVEVSSSYMSSVGIGAAAAATEHCPKPPSTNPADYRRAPVRTSAADLLRKTRERQRGVERRHCY